MESFKFRVVVMATLYYFISSGSINAQTLTAVKCAATLTSVRAEFDVLYDKNDSVYVFGGYRGVNSAEVLKYSISQDTIEVVGQLPYPDSGGAAVLNKFRNIFYLAGAQGNDIFQYFPDLRSFTNVSSLRERERYSATVSPDPDTALLFGGARDPRSIISLNLNTLESEQIARLAENANYPTAIWVEEKNAAYIFSGRMVQKYLRSSNRTERLWMDVPIHSLKHGAIWDGRFVYLIGSVCNGRVSTQNIVQFDPETETVGLISVENFEPTDWATAVYIEKLNRIYTFGGWTSEDRRYDNRIFYIDLDPLTEPPVTTTEETPVSTMDPDIFDCRGRPDSNYQYPGDCTKFVICRGDHGYPFDCPEPLHFDPVNRHCTFPDKAECE